MSGHLSVVGIGPGDADLVTPEAAGVLAEGEVFFGYVSYLDRIDLRPDQRRIASDNREELSRAQEALVKAVSGASVAVVSGGDPGVFAMAAAVCEAIESGPAEWREVDVRIVPGVTAMLAVAARIGAPLGHDFCLISLSDNLKPWSIITERLDHAARADFAMAFYNPISKARPWQLGEAIEILRRHRAASTPVVLGRDIGRPAERLRIVTLGELVPEMVDMRTVVIVGSSTTRRIARPDGRELVYTPRWYGAAPVAKQA